MKGRFIKVEDQEIHYYKFGSGPKIILAFHGFGLDGQSFEPITEKLKSTHTIYSLDLFYHGKTYASKDHKPITPSTWAGYIAAIIAILNIEKFSIMCFSMGGKFALATLQCIPHRVEKCVFIAPDGIKTSKWYNLATYPLLFRNYFRSMIVKPKRFYSIVTFFKKLKLLDKGLSKFAVSQMNTVKKRRRVYYSWVLFKDLSFDMSQVAGIINEHKISIVMILGKYDKIITARGMQKLLSKLDSYDLEIIESGHHDLIKNVAEVPDLKAYF